MDEIGYDSVIKPTFGPVWYPPVHMPVRKRPERMASFYFRIVSMSARGRA